MEYLNSQTFSGGTVYDLIRFGHSPATLL